MSGQESILTGRASRPAAAEKAAVYVALTGNPNCGKTTIFNALTGLRSKVGNYAGVTVERKEGRMLGAGPRAVTILDLPGTYSLSPKSLDEQIARDVLFHAAPEIPAPSLLVVVVDASNLERNLYYATQVIELGLPTLVALNMMDVAAQSGAPTDPVKLSHELGVEVVPVVARVGEGISALRGKILQATAHPRPPRIKSFPERSPEFAAEAQKLSALLEEMSAERAVSAEAEAILLLSDEKTLANGRYPESARRQVEASRQRLEAAGEDWRSSAIEGRYMAVAAIHQRVASPAPAITETLSDKLDRVLTHRVWGLLIFVAIMTVMFEAIFSWARYPMDGLQSAVAWLGSQAGRWIPHGDLRSLLVDGVIAGVGAVVVFLPQICLLFFFISLLEDTGYMARAAFLMDRLMSRVGLHGKSFIPMLSSFACAIPGIMATRTIENPKDRLATILVSPLMSCSARLPVYTLLIAACIPDRTVFGFLALPGVVMLAMYLLGIIMALAMAWLFKRTLLRGEPPLLIMELPPYRLPVLKVVARQMWDRSKLFLRRAGTVILGISILLWFMATYPRHPALEKQFAEKKAALMPAFSPNGAPAAAWAASQKQELSELTQELGPVHPWVVAQTVERLELSDLERQYSGESLRQSFAGTLGRAIEPALAPLGFDWKIGIGIVGSFAAREVFVSTMSTVYNVGGDDSAAGLQTLAKTLQSQRRPGGAPLYTPLLAITLMVFYVFALQCVSTVAVVRRETNSWRWPLFQWLYMGALAWGLAFLTFQAGHWLGYK